MEFEFMKNAYGLLYRLENTLRTFINETMEKKYGADWIIKAPLSMKYPPIKKIIRLFIIMN